VVVWGGPLEYVMLMIWAQNGCGGGGGGSITKAFLQMIPGSQDGECADIADA
jgi:hypothetical protein